MTYCVAMLPETGLVFLSQSRISAGVDQINTFRKTSVLQQPGQCVLVLQGAGNLPITQAVVTLLRERVDAARDGKLPEPCGLAAHLLQAGNMFVAARQVGDACGKVHRRDASSLKEFAVQFNARLILRGQIRGEPPRLFSICATGNFIEATPDTTYFQIGNSKYGKPFSTPSSAAAAVCAKPRSARSYRWIPPTAPLCPSATARSGDRASRSIHGGASHEHE